MNAGRAIFTILTDDETLSGMVGTKIYPEAAPEDVETPFVVYSVQSVEPLQVKNSTSTLDIANFVVYTSSPNYAQAMLVNEAIRAALERKGGTFSTVAIDSIEYIDENVEFDIDSREYLSEMRFRLRIARAGAVSSNDTVVPLGVNVRETDDTDVTFVKTVVFPDTSLSVTDQTATVTFSTGGGGGESTVQLFNAKHTATSPLTTFGGTETQISLSTIDVNTTSGWQISNGRLRAGGSGTAMVTIFVSVQADTNHQLPHVKLYQNTREVFEATGYITGQHGDDHCSISGNAVFGIAANDMLEIKGYNDAGSTNLGVLSATLSVMLVE